MEVGQHSRHSKTQQRHRKGHLIQAHSNCKNTGEEHFSLHNSKHTHTTLYSDATRHIKQHRSKGIQPDAPPSANNIKFITNYIKVAKPTQHIEITHPHVNSKLAFHKVALFHQHYSTFTLQTYHHPEHRFRPWLTQMTSPSHLTHKHEYSQEIHTTIHT